MTGDSGQAIAAALAAPEGVAVDGSGNIYIADTGNNRIRKITVSTGVITAHAGNGTACTAGTAPCGDSSAGTMKFNAPSDLLFRSNGDLIIADTGNNTIRRFAANSQVITTVAGAAGQNTACAGTAVSGITLSAPEDVVAVGPIVVQ